MTKYIHIFIYCLIAAPVVDVHRSEIHGDFVVYLRGGTCLIYLLLKSSAQKCESKPEAEGQP